MSFRLDSYEVLVKLADGPAGEVWFARDASGEPVAVKLLHPELARSQEYIQALVRVVRDTAGLTHPGVAKVRDFRLSGSRYFLVVDLVHGESLASVVLALGARGRALPLDVGCDLLRRSCALLAHLHGSAGAAGETQGLVHRALTGNELFVTYDGQVRLTDLGVAAVPLPPGVAPEEMVVARLRHLAPEQTFNAPADVRTDVYALATIFWEIFTGRPLVDGSEATAVKSAVVHTVPPALGTLRRDAPASLAKLMARALAKAPDARFQSCAEMGAAAEAVIAELPRKPSRGRVAGAMGVLFPERKTWWESALATPEPAPKAASGSLLDGAMPAPEATDETAPTQRRRPTTLGPTRVAGRMSRAPETQLFEAVPRRAAPPEPEPAVATPEPEPVVAAPEAPTRSQTTSYAPSSASAPVGRTAETALPEDEPEPPVGRDDSLHLSAQAPLAVPPDGYEPDIFREEEDDDDDLPPVPDFRPESALAALPEPAVPGHGERLTALPIADVVRWSGGNVIESAVVRPGVGRRSRFGGKESPLRASMMGRTCTLKLGPRATGIVRRREGESFREEHAAPQTSVVLQDGDEARVSAGPDTFSVRVYRPPRGAVGGFDRIDITPWVVLLVVALLLHGAAAFGIERLDEAGVTVTVDKPTEEKFADAVVKKVKRLKGEKKKPKKKKVVKKRKKVVKKRKKVADKEPPKAEPNPKIPKAVRKKLAARLQKRASGKSRTERAKSVFTTPHQGSAQTLKEAVTTVQATKARGASDAFRMGGSIGHLPGSDVNYAVDGGGDPGTIGDGAATKGVPHLAARAKKKGGRVRGKVRTVKALAKVKGTLSRAAVLKVIGKHQGAIQRCYERELQTTPGLSGKLTFAWTIATSGRVRTAKLSSGTMSNSKVTKCILGVIRKMKFPKPQGGPVEVIFPFIFRSSS